MQIVKAILKDILGKTCRYFTITILVYNAILASLHTNVAVTIVGAAINVRTNMTPSIVLVFILASFFAAVSTQIFKITKIPVFARHIGFFILIYATFIFAVLPLSPGQVRPQTTLMLSIIFIVVYLLIFGIYMGMKSIITARRNKKSEYKEIYKKNA